MTRSILLASLIFVGCGSSNLDVGESAYVDHDPAEATFGLTAGQAGGCDTSIVQGLSNQLLEELNCISAGSMVSVAGSDTRYAASVNPFLQGPAAAALHRATAAAHDYMTLNDAYRTVAQQYVLFNWWHQGRCNIQVAAAPGASNHQSGRAIDISAYTYWRSYLQAQGWSWYGSSDVVHYDFLSVPALGGRSVLAFQRLWNKNNANKLAEDGVWGPASSGAMAASPTTGFGTHGCAAPPPPAKGTLKGIVYKNNPANAADTAAVIAGATVKVGGQTLTTDPSGIYTASLSAGAATITVTAAGYVDASLSRQITGGQTVWGSIGLTPIGMPDTTPPDLALTSPEPGAQLDVSAVVITGTASDTSGSAVKVTLSRVGGTPEAVTLAANAFAHQLTLKPGVNEFEVKATDAAGNVATMSVTLTFRAGVEGEVTTLADLPAAIDGVLITMRDANGAVISSMQTGADGHYGFDITDVPVHVQLTAEATGYQTIVQEVDVTAESRAVVAFQMSASAGIAGNTSGNTPSPALTDDMKARGGCSAAPGLSFALAAVGLLLRRRRAA